MDAGKFNTRNPAVKRILQEIKELQRENNPDMMAEALEDNIFEWHFAIRGPPDSEFQGGIYHGRILLPPDYPFKPPSFMLLTPNGRFETGVKICLSISSHHPEHWQPSWSVRTALTALVAFLPSPGGGAIGSLDFPKEERRRLAAKSRSEPPMFGSTERQAVTRSVHQRMLDAQTAEASANQAAQDPRLERSATKGGQTQATESQPQASEVQAAPVTPAGLPLQENTDLQPQQLLEEAPALPDTNRPTSFVQQTSALQESSWEDTGLGFLAAGLTMAILAILGRRLLIIAGVEMSNFF